MTHLAVVRAAALSCAMLVAASSALGAQDPKPRPVPDSVRTRPPQSPPGGGSTGGSTSSGGGATTGGGTAGGSSTGGSTGGAAGGTAVATVKPPRAASGRHGKYRVTLNGIAVMHQTYDHVLSLDGKGDEIFLAAHVAVFDTTRPEIVQHAVVQSEIYGDVNGFPSRVQAGSASDKGGILTTNRIPSAAPFRRTGEPQVGRLPMVLFEGELTQGTSALVLVPTVWEWDDNPVYFNCWLNSRQQFVTEMLAPDPLNAILRNLSSAPVEIGTQLFAIEQAVIGEASDRPVGLLPGQPAGARSVTACPRSGRAVPAQRSAGKGASYKLQPPSAKAATDARKALQQSAAKPTGLAAFAGLASGVIRGLFVGRYYFYEKVLVLTPETIETLLSTSSTIGGRPPGVIDVFYEDTPSFQGRYTLYVQVERIP